MAELPILCYRNIEPVLYDDFIYRPGNIKNHLRLLSDNGYETITCQHLGEYITGNVSLPAKPVIITFDNGYTTYYDYVLKSLQEYSLTATFFISGELAWKSTCMEFGYDKVYMDIDQLKNLHHKGFEIAMHSYSNNNFSDLHLSEIQNDIDNSISFFEKFGLIFTKAIAFPDDFKLSGTRRKKDICWLLSNLGIVAAFQPGNKPNVLSSLIPYEINRLTIREHFSCEELMKKIQGKSYRLW